MLPTVNEFNDDSSAVVIDDQSKHCPSDSQKSVIPVLALPPHSVSDLVARGS